MAFNAGQIIASLGLNISGFLSGIKQATATAAGLGNSMSSGILGGSSAIRNASNATQQLNRDMRELQNIVSGILISQSFYRATNAIENATKSLVGFMNNMEKAQIGMEYFLESPEKAEAFIANMKDFAATTAFSTEQALQLSRKIMGAQFDPKNVRSIMEILNDSAAATGGTAEQMDRIVLALTQMRTNGKIAATEMRQFAEAGIPIYQILHEELGIAKEDLLNIGDLKIDGDLGVKAVLEGLEKRYKGAALRIANTMGGMWETIKDDSLMVGSEIFQGPYKAMEKFIRRWRDGMEKAREILTQSGIGGLFEHIVPDGMEKPVKLILGSIQAIFQNIGTILSAFGPAISIVIQAITYSMAAWYPIIAMVTNALAWLTTTVFNAIPGLQYLVAAIIGLMVASAAARALQMLWTVMRVGVIASAVAGAVLRLAAAIRVLTIAIATNPIGALVTVMVGALMYLAMSSKTVVGWLDTLIDRLASLGGFDMGKMFQPEDNKSLDDMTSEFNKGINDPGSQLGDMGDAGDAAGDAMDKAGDKADKAGKKGKKAAKEVKDAWLATFDEVYQVPDKKDGSGDDGAGDDGAGKDKGGKGSGAGPGSAGVGAFDLGKNIIEQSKKVPREIQLPKLKFPDIDWPILPPWLQRPIPISFKIDPPDWPMPPTAFVTGLAISMNAMRAWGASIYEILQGTGNAFNAWTQRVGQSLSGVNIPLGGVSVALDAVGQALGRISPPVGAAIGAFGGLSVALDSVGQVLDRVNQALDSVEINVGETANAFISGVSSILEPWETGWSAITLTSAIGALQVVANSGQMFNELQGQFQTGMQVLRVITAGWIAGHIVSIQGMWARVTGIWNNALSGIQGFLSGALDNLKRLWEDHKVAIILIVAGIILGIVLLFTGLPATLVGIVGTLVTRLGPAFARIVPKFAESVKAIGPKFKEILDDLPKAVPKIIDDIVSYFSKLPSRIGEAVSGIPGAVKSAFSGIKLPSFKTAAEGVTATFTRLGDLAGFANGGIIGRDSIVRVGERGRREAIIPLQNGSAMNPYADAVASRLARYGNFGGSQTSEQQAEAIAQYLARYVGTNGGSQSQAPQQLLYVGTLIADDRGLKELERKMKIIRINEDVRGGAV